MFEIADGLAIEAYRITAGFPKAEMFAITSQIRRAALSIPTNIVEGSHRESMGEYIRFLDIALGSLAETGYLMEFAKRLGYCENVNMDSWTNNHELCIKMLKGLINSLRAPKP